VCAAGSLATGCCWSSCWSRRTHCTSERDIVGFL
jgi:hypothetical protein